MESNSPEKSLSCVNAKQLVALRFAYETNQVCKRVQQFVSQTGEFLPLLLHILALPDTNFYQQTMLCDPRDCAFLRRLPKVDLIV